MTNKQHTVDWLEKNGPMVRRVCGEAGIPWQLCVGQGLAESGLGKSVLGKVHNLWGLKFRPELHSDFTTKKTREVRNGCSGYIDAKFASFDSLEAGVWGYCHFLSKVRYKHPDRKLLARHPLRFMAWIWGRGYATALKYVEAVQRRLKKVYTYTGDESFDVEIDAGLAGCLKELRGVEGSERHTLAILILEGSRFGMVSDGTGGPVMGVKDLGEAAAYTRRFLTSESMSRLDLARWWERYTPEGSASITARGEYEPHELDDETFIHTIVCGVQRFAWGDDGDAVMGEQPAAATEKEVDGKLGGMTHRRMETWEEFVAEPEPTIIERFPDLPTSDHIIFFGEKIQVPGVKIVSMEEPESLDIVRDTVAKYGKARGVKKWPLGDARNHLHGDSKYAKMLGFLHWDAGWSAEGAYKVLMKRGLGSSIGVDRPRKGDGQVIAYQWLDPGKYLAYHGGSHANRRAVMSFDLSNAVYLKYAGKYLEMCGIPRPKVRLLHKSSGGHLGMYRGQILTTLRILEALSRVTDYPLQFPVRTDWKDTRGFIQGRNWKDMWKRNDSGGFRGVATHEHLPSTTKWDIRCWGEQVVVLLLKQPELQLEFPSLKYLYRLDDKRWMKFMDLVEANWEWAELGIGVASG